MKLTIQETQEQPSLHRKQVTARLFFQAETPSRQLVADALSEEIGADRGLVVVDTIRTSFGDTSANVLARVYEDEQFMQDLERANLLEKNKKVEPEPEPEPEPESEEPDEEESSAEEAADEEAEEKDE